MTQDCETGDLECKLAATAILRGDDEADVLADETGRGPGPDLPIALTSFIGRERELGEVRRLLGSTRLLTLTGPAGCGKTRLALESAGALQHGYRDGVRLAELAALSDAALVPETLAAAIGARARPGRSLLDTLIAFLKPCQQLLVLDNCEHLVAACGVLAEALLRACPQLRILATSREALGVGGETIWSVPPLSLPARGRPRNAERLLNSEAVRLFIDRVRAVQPAFVLSEENGPAIARICLRLDGLPLALELAAAQARLLAVEQIAARVHDRFTASIPARRTAEPRHQTLQAAVDWSYNLLDQAERRLFERLAVFAGGFSLEAATAVGAGGDVQATEVVDRLGRLVEQSLVSVEIRGGEAHYRLLETLRQYGEERLAARGEAEATRRRHAEWFLALAEVADAELRGPETAAALARLERERDNLRAALRWAAASGETVLALRLGAALWYFWYLRNDATEGFAQLSALLALLPPAGQEALRGRVLIGASYVGRHHGEQAEARSLAEEALACFRSVDDRAGIAFAAQTIGFEARVEEDYATARPLLEESLALFRERGDEFRTATSLHHLGLIALDHDGEVATARLLQEESLAIYRRVGSQRQIALVLLALGQVDRAAGDRAGACSRLCEGLRLLADLGDEWSISLALDQLAALAADERRFVRAVRLAGATAALHERLGTAPWPVVQRERERWLEQARRALGEQVHAEAWDLGRCQALWRTVAEALDPDAERDGAAIDTRPSAAAGPARTTAVPLGPPSPAETAPVGLALSPREREVLRLLAGGKTNQEIAAALTLSVYTVQNHLANIYAKIGARRRVDATTYALRHGLA